MWDGEMSLQLCITGSGPVGFIDGNLYDRVGDMPFGNPEIHTLTGNAVEF